MSRIGVLGAGAWGTTLADLLVRREHEVLLWAYEPDVAEAVNTRHENPTYLEGATLAPALRATNDPCEAVADAELVLSVVPSHVVRSVLERAAPAIPGGIPLVSATKGIETDTLELMSQVIRWLVPQARFAALSGPSFAREVLEGQPTAVVAAADDAETAHEVQAAFATPRFRVYTGRDVIGAELGGALKNVIAIAAGMLEGLGLGYNPRAALLTRGLAEITRLGIAMGADPLTFAGLAGMGDLILTATGPLSRNRSLGVALAQGTTLAEYQASRRTVAEGVNTSRAAKALAERHGVELPLTAQVCDILFHDKEPADCVAELMGRELKSEQWR